MKLARFNGLGFHVAPGFNPGTKGDLRKDDAEVKGVTVDGRPLKEANTRATFTTEPFFREDGVTFAASTRLSSLTRCFVKIFDPEGVASYSPGLAKPTLGSRAHH